MGNFFFIKEKLLILNTRPSPFKNTIVYIMKYMGHSSSNKYYILHLRNDNVNICISDEKRKITLKRILYFHCSNMKKNINC